MNSKTSRDPLDAITNLIGLAFYSELLEGKMREMRIFLEHLESVHTQWARSENGLKKISKHNLKQLYLRYLLE